MIISLARYLSLTHTWAALSDIDLDLFGRNNMGNLRLTTTRPPRVTTSSVIPKSIWFTPRSLTRTLGFLKRSNFGGLGMMFVGGCCVHWLKIGETWRASQMICLKFPQAISELTLSHAEPANRSGHFKSPSLLTTSQSFYRKVSEPTHRIWTRVSFMESYSSRSAFPLIHQAQPTCRYPLNIS